MGALVLPTYHPCSVCLPMGAPRGRGLALTLALALALTLALTRTLYPDPGPNSNPNTGPKPHIEPNPHQVRRAAESGHAAAQFIQVS